MKFRIIGILIIVIIFIVFMITTEEAIEKTYSKSLDELQVATFAGGCFWCMEGAFEALGGVEEVISGYTGGGKPNPSYDEVIGGKTGHYEAVQIYYDQKIISYSELVEQFWRNIDPTDDGGQFSDRGSQYKTGIFYSNNTEKEIAEKSKNNLDNSGKFDKPIVTKILPLGPFYEAEEYHQDYYIKKSTQYKAYEKGSGRKDYIEETWGLNKLK